MDLPEKRPSTDGMFVSSGRVVFIHVLSTNIELPHERRTSDRLPALEVTKR
jgi:hypothetical protein